MVFFGLNYVHVLVFNHFQWWDWTHERQEKFLVWCCQLLVTNCWTPFADKPSYWLELYSTEYHQLLTLENWFTNLEQTPLNRSQSLPYQHLIKLGDLLMNWSKLAILKVPGKTGSLTNNTTVIILTKDRSKGASFLWSSYLLLILLIFNCLLLFFIAI